MAANCTTFTVKRRRKGGKTLPKSQWKRVTRCKSHKLKYKGGKRCRAGGADWKQKVRAMARKGQKVIGSRSPARFVPCR